MKYMDPEEAALDSVPIEEWLEESLEWNIDADNVRERIDKYIADRMGEGVSRTQIQGWIKSGHVTVNGNPVKTNYKLAGGDQLAVVIPEAVVPEAVPEDIPLEVMYEDSDVIVVNKPRGMVVHPALGHYTGTLVNALLYHCKDLSGINGEMRPGIVHRIDKDTSGLIMAAKNDVAHASLASQLKEHSVTRVYVAVVHGNVTHDHGTVDAPLGRDPYDRKLFKVTAKNSKHAVTHFSVKERIDDFTVLELKLETGRTHQIRVHMKYIGHPIVGDPAYGLAKTTQLLQGQALHASTLGFVHPRTGEYKEFQAEIPDDMKELMARLRNR